MLEEFLTCLEGQGWSVIRNTSAEVRLPEAVAGRYRSCPPSWLALLGAVQELARGDERAWFLCAGDYDVQADQPWQWNEWERLSLEAAGDDALWTAEIRDFWTEHLPIFMSLSDGYAYYAISMKDGSVVYGREPEFEECETAAPSFDAFMEQIVKGQTLL